jgi:hypothetical protein
MAQRARSMVVFTARNDIGTMQFSRVLFATLLVGSGTLLVGCAGLPPARALPPTFAIQDVSQTALARLARSRSLSAALGTSGFRLLPEAAFAFDARVALIRNAERSIDMQYYLIRNDDVGLLLLPRWQ